MKRQTLGYIVITEYFGKPLELCEYKRYPWPVLLRGDFVTVFKTRKAANTAIDKTIEWANIREQEDESLKPLEWAEKGKYQVWRLVPDGVIST